MMGSGLEIQENENNDISRPDPIFSIPKGEPQDVNN
jgi:hypothetical protein